MCAWGYLGPGFVVGIVGMDLALVCWLVWFSYCIEVFLVYLVIGMVSIDLDFGYWNGWYGPGLWLLEWLVWTWTLVIGMVGMDLEFGLLMDYLEVWFSYCKEVFLFSSVIAMVFLWTWTSVLVWGYFGPGLDIRIVAMDLDFVLLMDYSGVWFSYYKEVVLFSFDIGMVGTDLHFGLLMDYMGVVLIVMGMIGFNMDLDVVCMYGIGNLGV